MNEEETMMTKHEESSAEAERLRAENDDLKRELHIRTAVYDIQTQLLKAGARSPELLANAARSMLQIGEDGRLENASAAIEQLKRDFPEQFEIKRQVASIDGGAGQKTGSTLTKEALARMSPTEIQQLDWAEVRAVLSEKLSA